MENTGELADNNKIENQLYNQIDKYPGEHAQLLIDLKENPLYKDIDDYQKGYKGKIENYQKKNKLVVTDSSDDMQYFRKKFINYILNHEKPSFIEGDDEEANKLKRQDRENNPEIATIKMEQFLDKEGLELYKLALEEERYSTNYMDAVFEQSTTIFPGKPWMVRPVVIVAGPSGAGKTTAARAAIENANQFLPKDNDPTSLTQNKVVAVDGGVAREVSQMRKLVIHMANKQGYSGINDLHKQSKIQAAAVANPKLGIVIPKTFSKPNSTPKILSKIDKLPNTKPIFTRVDGVERDNKSQQFKNIVAFMGERRAWKSGGFDSNEPLDLNAPTKAESKAYGGGGFWAGVLGSKFAEKWFKFSSKEKLSMVITNDLMIVKPDANKNLVPAKSDDKGARLVAERVVHAWNEQNKLQNATTSALASDQEKKEID